MDLEREMALALAELERLNVEALAVDLELHAAVDNENRDAFGDAHERGRELAREHALAVVRVAGLEFEAIRAEFLTAQAAHLEVLERHNAAFRGLPEGSKWAERSPETREWLKGLKADLRHAYDEQQRRRKDQEDAWGKYYQLSRDAGLETGALYVGWDTEVTHAVELEPR